MTEARKIAKAAYDKIYRAVNREKIREYKRIWAANNPEKILVYRKTWDAANPEKKSEWGRKRYSDNPARSAKNGKAWRSANPDKNAAKRAKQRAARLKATPTWADDFVISEAYELARLRTKATGVVHHVDHIVPIKGKKVCGLHCEFNLKVIPARENAIKSNKHCPDTF